jgi:hypothetical protein
MIPEALGHPKPQPLSVRPRLEHWRCAGVIGIGVLGFGVRKFKVEVRSKAQREYVMKPFFFAITALGILGAFLLDFVVPVHAGTCVSIQATGRGDNAAAATTNAQHKLVQRAARRGGRLRNHTTNCRPYRRGFECTMSASLCP